MSIHLYTRSCYTLLDSTVRIPALVAKAKEEGCEYVALTDHNVMHGTASFLHECRKQGIKPIIGLEADCFFHEEKVPFLLLAKDNAGYASLMKLSSLLAGGKEACSEEELKKAALHCVLIVYGEGGWFDGELVNGDTEAVRRKLEVMKQELPSFDVALSYMEASLWKMRNETLKRICSSMQIRTVALNKIYYLQAEDAEAYRVLRGIRSGTNLLDASLLDIRGRYFLSEKEMHTLYAEDDLKRTEEIAAMCRADFRLPETSLPKFHLKDGVTAEEYLPQLCMAGLRKRLNGKEDARYTQRLKYELDVIARMHFEDYFLIVYDFIRYARKNGIYVGPGRGSAAGSLVAYCLGITMVDPLKYHLLFERFLNPERVSMPDIDTDIPDNRREEVIQYVYETYGAEHIANIITFGTLGARQVIRDVGKVMGFLPRDIDLITKLIPNVPKITLRKAYETTPRLRQVIASEERYTKMFRMAERIEGLPRHASIHAAGIIMSSLDLNDVIPTIQLSDGMKTSQFTMEYMQERGLIKMDFLGLRNLTIIDQIVQQIRKKDPIFDILHIPLVEPRAYEIFANGDTVGIFQFESEGMKNLLRRMKPKNILDVAAALALYRPGAADSIPAYLDARNNPSSVRYPAKELVGILQETNGNMIYQEQVMLSAEVYAGFSLAQADLLRKAMSKKNPEEMAKMKEHFIQGALQKGHAQAEAENLYATIEKFAGYGFNKSHAVAYSLIAYQMAYLKAVYPVEFYSALLNSVVGDATKTAQYIDECRRRKIRVAYPSVNVSEESYVFDGKQLILPLSVIHGVGVHVADILIEERRKKGTYPDFFDFTARAVIHKISRSQIEALIDAGALDCFGDTRRTMKRALDDAIRYSELVQIGSGDQITIDLGLVTKPGVVKMADSEDDRIECEREALGFNLGPSPIIRLRAVNNISVPPLAAIMNANGNVQSFAQIRSVKQHRTKKGDMMAFLKIADETAEMDMAVMPRQFAQYAPGLVKGAYILFDGKIGNEGSMLCNRVRFIKNSR